MKPLLNTILSSGTKYAVTQFDHNKMREFNKALALGILFVILHGLVSISNNLNYTFLMDLGFVVMLLMSFLINKFGYYTTAISFVFICTNAFIVGGTYVQGRFAGNYLYFIPITVVLALFVKLKEHTYLVIFFVCITFFCLYLSMTFGPDKSTLQPVADDLYFTLYKMNIVGAMSVSAAFSYVLYRVNDRNERKLVAEKNYVDMLFNSSVEGVIMLDSSSNLLRDCNQRALDLFEFTDKNLVIGKTVELIKGMFIDQDVDHAKYVDGGKIIIENSHWKGEVTFCTVKGKHFYAELHVQTFDYDGQHYKKVSITDITKQKESEIELRKAKNRAEESAHAKSRFLSNMSHELRTPLNGIIGTTNLMIDDIQLAEQKHNLDILKFSSEHMLHLVNDVLDYSKLEDSMIVLEQNHFNIKKIIEKTQAFFAAQFSTKELELICDIDENLDIVVVTDAVRLQQVLNNLLSNALKFTRKGQVTLSLKAKNLQSDSATIEFAIADTGIGIDKAMQELIFERFAQAETNTTRRFGGTGLGLTISKMIVDLLGGNLAVESEIGKGSRFYFELVLPRKEKVITDTQVKVAGADIANTRILVAEDNAINMMVVKRFLEKWGVQVTEASNGAKAVATFESGQFDMLLLDLEMPEMDGYQALEQIRKKDPSIPVLAFTAALYENMPEDLSNRGFTDFLQKPFKPEQLREMIEKYTAV
jgi:signal transduction histidine kinase